VGICKPHKSTLSPFQIWANVNLNEGETGQNPMYCVLVLSWHIQKLESGTLQYWSTTHIFTTCWCLQPRQEFEPLVEALSHDCRSPLGQAHFETEGLKVGPRRQPVSCGRGCIQIQLFDVIRTPFIIKRQPEVIPRLLS